MHITSYIFPIIFIPIYFGVFIALNDFDSISTFQELKWFFINVLSACSFAIPFIYFYLIYNKIFLFIKSKQINLWNNKLLLFLTILVFLYLIYYLLNIAIVTGYYLLISYLFKNSYNISVFEYLTKCSDYTHSLYPNNVIILTNNSINWGGFVVNLIVCFFYNLCLSGLYSWMVTNKKGYAFKLSMVYILLLIISSIPLVSMHVIPRTNIFNIIFSFSPLYYAYWLVNLSWCGVPLFNTDNYSLVDNDPMFHNNFSINVYIYVYGIILFSIFVLIYTIYIKKYIKKTINIKSKIILKAISNENSYELNSNSKKQFLITTTYLNKLECCIFNKFSFVNVNQSILFNALTFEQNILFIERIFDITFNRDKLNELLISFNLYNDCHIKLSKMDIYTQMIFSLIVCYIQQPDKKIIICNFNNPKLTDYVMNLCKLLKTHNKHFNYLVLNVDYLNKKKTLTEKIKERKLN